MNLEDRLLALNPRLSHTDIRRAIQGGEEYAAQFEKLLPHDRRNVAFFFAAYVLTDSLQYKIQIRRGIDSVLAPYYPGARTP